MNKINITKWKESNLKNFLIQNKISNKDRKILFQWLESDASKKYHRQLFKLAVPDALKLSQKWNETNLKKVNSNTLEVIYKFKNGFTIKKLKTLQDIHNEGYLMNNCLKKFHSFDISSSYFYSLRDKKNKPHATIQFDYEDNSIVQIKGKNNTILSSEYNKLMKEFLEKSKINVKKIPDRELYYAGLIRGNNKDLHDIYDMPKETLILNRDVFLNDIGIKIFPNITSKKFLDLSDNYISEFPKNYYQKGDLELLSNLIEKIPDGFKQNGTLNLSNNYIKEIPHDFKQNGYLILNGNLITEIPKGFKQNGDLYLRNNPIKKTPDGHILDGNIFISKNIKTKNISKNEYSIFIN